GVFYPTEVRTPEARLRYYASRFPLVEVDSTYYAIPRLQMATAWAERTPDEFTFNVKAHALMTGHATETSRLPADVRDALPTGLAAAKRVYARDLPEEVREEVWRSFRAALEPLRTSGELGAVLLQYAPWVRPARHTPDMLGRA